MVFVETITQEIDIWETVALKRLYIFCYYPQLHVQKLKVEFWKKIPHIDKNFFPKVLTYV